MICSNCGKERPPSEFRSKHEKDVCLTCRRERRKKWEEKVVQNAKVDPEEPRYCENCGKTKKKKEFRKKSKSIAGVTKYCAECERELQAIRKHQRELNKIANAQGIVTEAQRKKLKKTIDWEETPTCSMCKKTKERSAFTTRFKVKDGEVIMFPEHHCKDCVKLKRERRLTK